MTNVQNVYLCVSSTVVLPLVCLPSKYTSGEQNTRQIAWFRCYSHLWEHWTWNQEILLSDRTLTKFIHYAQRNWHKSLNCPECAQLSLVYRSARVTCRAVPLALYCCLFFTTPPWPKENQNTINRTFLVYTSHTHQERETQQIALFRCYFKLCAHWTWNQEGLPSDRTVPKFVHYAQERKMSWHKSLNSPECAQLSLMYCSVHETCAERFLLRYSVAFCSPHIPGKKKTKNTLSIILLV